MTRLQRALLAASALALVCTSAVVCQRVADRGRFAGAYSSYGSGPKGVRALFLLAQQLGAQPARWSQDLAALPARAMLIALGDCDSGMARPLSRYEEQELVRWVADGGVLLVAGARHYLPKGLGVRFEPEPRCRREVRFVRPRQQSEQDEAVPPELEGPPTPGASVPAAAGPSVDPDATDDLDELAGDAVVWTSPADAPLLGLDPIPMRNPGRLVIDDGAASRVILSMPDAPEMPESPIQREVGVIVRHGKGHVIALASASMLQNRALGLADGGVAFARLLRAYAAAGPLLFDEYHLGVGERRSLMRYLRQAGATAFIAQLLLCALLLLWRCGARFGGVRDPEPAAPAGTASFVAALGGLFARARDPAGAAQVLVKQALGRIAAYHHLPPSLARALAIELEQRGLREPAQAVRSIAEAEHALLADQGGLVKLSRRLDQAVARACR